MAESRRGTDPSAQKLTRSGLFVPDPGDFMVPRESIIDLQREEIVRLEARIGELQQLVARLEQRLGDEPAPLASRSQRRAIAKAIRKRG